VDAKRYTLGDAVGQVLRRVLRVQGNWSPPSELPERVLPVIEARASRPWELIDAGFIPFYRVITINAVAARFSGVWFGSGGVAQGRYCYAITQVKSGVTGSLSQIRLGALPAFANAVSGGVFSRDARLGNAEMFNGMWQGGDLAAVAPGVEFDTIGAGELRAVELLGRNPDPVPLGWLVQNLTANIAMAVALTGVLIPLHD